MIRHEVTGRQLEFFQEDRVRRARFLAASVGAVRHRDGFFFATIHRVLELQRFDAIIIRRLDGDREFVGGCGFGIAAWIGNRHAGLTIRQRFNGVLHRTRNGGTLGRHEIDAIKRVLSYLE